MRELKFRMWVPEEDGEPGYMISGDDLAFEEYLPVTDLLSQDGIMQYVGIKDNNGVELYEDDVVEITIFNPLLPEKIIVQKQRKIEFEAGVFGVRWNHILMPFCQFANTRIIKIGNIWENPELLEE